MNYERSMLIVQILSYSAVYHYGDWDYSSAKRLHPSSNHLPLNRSASGSMELWYLIMPINQRSWSLWSTSTLRVYKCGLPYTKSSGRSMDPKLYSILVWYWSYHMVRSLTSDPFWVWVEWISRRALICITSQGSLQWPTLNTTITTSDMSSISTSTLLVLVQLLVPIRRSWHCP